MDRRAEEEGTLERSEEEGERGLEKNVLEKERNVEEGKSDRE